jgi:hypothetical protein
MHDPTRSFVSWDGEFEEFYKQGGIMDTANTTGEAALPAKEND